MFDKLRKFFAPAAARVRAVDFPSIERSAVSHLLVRDHGMCQVDWGMATAWISQRMGDVEKQDDLRRAIAAAWLDQLRDDVTTDSRRWRRGIVEGLAPLENSSSVRLANWAERSLSEIGRALTSIRGDGPIAPIAVIGLGTHEEYYSFVTHFYHGEEASSTSGGLYIRSDGDSIPILAIDAQVNWGIENAVAHELTHHALCGCRLPLWAEEGLTQMMEERVSGNTAFAINQEKLQRHRALWLEDGFDALMDGSGFHSPEGDVQELSYHMSQMMTRALLSTRPKQFFAFARACATAPAEFAAKEHLGATPEAIAEALLR